MVKKAFKEDPDLIQYFPKRFITAKMAQEAVEENPYNILQVPTHLITEPMLWNARKENPEMKEIQGSSWRFSHAKHFNYWHREARIESESSNSDEAFSEN